MFVPVLTVFFWTYKYFQATNRELKRLDAIARSPIFSYFSQCLNGLPTIRAFRSQGQVVESSSGIIDRQVRMNLATFSANRWLSIRLELLGGIMIFGASLFVVATRYTLNGGQTGLVLSYALQITGLLNMTIRLAAAAENSLNSVERIQQYCVVDEEKVEGQPGANPPSSWPSEGAIVFKDVSMK